MMGYLRLLWLPIYYMESRRNASPSIETLKSNSTEDDTCGKKAREKPRKATKIVRALLSRPQKNRRHTKMHSFVSTYEGDYAIHGSDPQWAIS